MATLPSIASLTGASTTNAQQKTNFEALRNFLADFLGTDSADKAAARALLGVPASADFTVSKATSGWQKLAGGLILQWGTSAASNGSGQAVFTFPNAFPNAALFALANANASGAGSNGYTAISISSVTIPIYTSSTGAPLAGATASIFVIGH